MIGQELTFSSQSNTPLQDTVPVDIALRGQDKLKINHIGPKFWKEDERETEMSLWNHLRKL